MTLTIRCSGTDRVMGCTGSLLPVEHPYNPNNPEAIEGRAVHAALEAIPHGVEPDVVAIASEFGVDPESIEDLVTYGREAWGELGEWFPGPQTEYPMSDDLDSGTELRGMSDLVSFGPNHLAVLDWKSGWLKTEHPNQLKSYATLLDACHDSSAEFVLGVEVWLRFGKARIHKFTRDDLQRHREKLLEQVRSAGDQWGPGPITCQYCPRQNVCESRQEYVAGAGEAISPMAANRYPVSRDMIAALWDKRTELYRALKRFDAVAGELLVAGPIDLDDERQLELAEKSSAKVIPSKAMSILRNDLRLTPDEANAVLRVSKTSLESVVKARAVKGKGAAAVRELMATLKKADALATTTRLEKRVTKKEVA